MTPVAVKPRPGDGPPRRHAGGGPVGLANSASRVDVRFCGTIFE